jgi:hypothetical protein
MNDDDLRSLYRRTMVRPRQAEGEACPPPEALRSVAEGEADEDARLTVLEHVAGCGDCQRELALLAHVADTRARRRAVPIRVPGGVPMGWVAAAAVLVLAFIGGRALATRESAAPVMRGNAPSVTLVAPTGRLPAAPAPLFVWRSVEGATRYEVEVLGPGAEPVAVATVRDTVMPAPSDLEPGVRYRWRVTALRPDGTRLESALLGFDLVRE